MTRGSGAARRSRICHQTDASDETRLGNFFHETPVFVYMADAHVRVEGAWGDADTYWCVSSQVSGVTHSGRVTHLSKELDRHAAHK